MTTPVKTGPNNRRNLTPAAVTLV